MARNGLKDCETAFDRLKAGKPHVAAHVGLDGTKITAGIVSVEAGFDRGYLKKSRPSHRELIAQIEAFRNSFGSLAASRSLQVKRANDKVSKARSELEIVQEQLYQVMTLNIQLVERVRSLEAKLKFSSNVKDLPKRH